MKIEIKTNSPIILESGYNPKVQISTRMHIGAAAEPIVSCGDSVKCGQLIAAMPQGQMGANIHASIDGTVTYADDTKIVIERN